MKKRAKIRIVALSMIMMSLFLGVVPGETLAGNWNGWVYQNPYPTPNTLLAVKFVTPRKGWLAGENGIILVTEDGGETWEAQESGTEQDLKSLAFISERKGWAVGKDGIIIHTEDGGKNWEKQTEAPAPLHNVFFLNENQGWIGGAEGTFLYTSDGGKNWNKQNIATRMDIAGIFFITPKTGWVLSSGRVFRTTDGGKSFTWSALPAVTMPGRRGIASPVEQGWEGSVFFINEKKGWATAGLWYIYSSEDGGITWKASTLAESVDRIAFTDEKNGCMAASSIYCTEDGGKTWQERMGIKYNKKETVEGQTVSIWGLSFADKSTGWAVGKQGQIWKTADGGKSWKLKSGYRPFVYLWDSKTAWGIIRDQKTNKPGIAKTEDGGNTWQIQKLFDNPETYDNRVHLEIFFVDSKTGWIAGQEMGRDKYKGPVVLNYFILHTSDGGITWATQLNELGGELGLSNDFQDIYFPNSDLGWAVGRNGFILHTKDGGKHWERQQSGSKSELWSVQFVDSKKGWVIGNKVTERNGTPIVLYTDNGGERWQIQWRKKTNWAWLQSLSFTDEKNGRFMGEIHEYSGDLLFVQTTDGGKTWSEKEFPEIFPDKMYFLDHNRGVILTEKGQMFITNDGGRTWSKKLKPVRVNPWHVSEIFK